MANPLADGTPIPNTANSPGVDNGALGPSDTSDSGSDVAPGMRGRDSDATGTGERAGVEPLEREDIPADLAAGHVVDDEDAGLAHTPPDPARNGGER